VSVNNPITTEMGSHGTCATTMVIQVMLVITHDRGAKMKGHKIDGVYRHSMQQSQGLKWGSMPYRLARV